MSLRARLGCLAFAYLVVVAIGAALGGYYVVRRNDVTNELTGARVAQQQAQELRSGFLDMETGQRGYLISGDQTFLEPFQTGHDRVDRVFADGPGSRSGAVVDGFADVRAAGDAWLNLAALPEITARRTAGPGAADAMEASGTGKVAFDRLRATLDRLDQLTAADVERLRADGRTASNRIVVVFAGLLLSTIALTVLAAWLVRRWVTRPVARLVDSMREVAAGGMSMVALRGPEELRLIGEVVDGLQRRVRAERDEAVRARQALEQSATLVLRVQSELAGDLGDFLEGWSVAGSLVPAEGLVAGDCFDLSLVSARNLGLTVFDIAGHGASAAITAIKCKEIVLAALRAGRSPGHALRTLYDRIHGMPEGFVTVFVAVIEVATGQCRYASAGHPPSFVLGPAGTLTLPPTGPLLGPIDAQWGTEQVTIEPGGKLVAYTDGVTEARDQSRLFYGEDRLTELLQGLDCNEAIQVVEHILDDLATFTSARRDDATLVVACRSAA